MRKPKALLVDTNFSSAPIYSVLQSKGYEVFIIGRNPQDFLAKRFPNYIQADYTDTQILLKVIQENEIDVVVPGCNDHSYEACSKIKFRNKNIDNFEEFEKLIDKKEFRKFAVENNLSVPQLLNKNDFSSLSAPDKIIIKPVDGFSGKGITKLTSPSEEEVNKAINQAKLSSKKQDFLIEEFVDGQLYSHSAFLRDHKVIQSFIVEEHTTVNPFVVDFSYLKFDLLPEISKGITKEVERISSLLNLRDGLIHTQFIASNEKYWLIEITRRCPGDLYSRLIELSCGVNYSEMYVQSFIGEVLNPVIPKYTRSIVRHTITQSDSGILEGLSFFDSNQITYFVPISSTGDQLEPSPDGRVGIIYIETRDGFDAILKKLKGGNLYSIDMTSIN